MVNNFISLISHSTLLFYLRLRHLHCGKGKIRGGEEREEKNDESSTRSLPIRFLRCTAQRGKPFFFPFLLLSLILFSTWRQEYGRGGGEGGDRLLSNPSYLYFFHFHEWLKKKKGRRKKKGGGRNSFFFLMHRVRSERGEEGVCFSFFRSLFKRRVFGRKKKGKGKGGVARYSYSPSLCGLIRDEH